MSENVLSVTALEKSYGDRLILGGVTLGLDRGQVVGLVGANGTGKSTFLRIIVGCEEADAGTVVTRHGVDVFYLEQEPTLTPGSTVRALLEEPLRPWIQAVDACDTEAIEAFGGWDWQHRLERAATQVGITNLDDDVDVLSGGQRKRVALARMVLSEPGLILLDEPTNHLDTETIDWMESWLATTPATVILVTHDRYFLDAVVEQMLELREGQLRVYAGAYTEYLEARALEEAHGTTVRKRRLQLLRGELEWARRSPKARRSKAKARLSRLQDVQREHRELQVEERIAEVRFGDPPRLGKTILELTSVTRGYGEEPPLIRDFSMILRRGERFGIVGPNGCGKSTLLRMIAGQLEPERGTITRGSNTRIAWFDQTRSFLDPSATVRQTVLPAGGEYVTAGGERRHVVGWLGRFAFPTSTHQLKVSSLSGGERNRLAIAKLLLEEANLFLLDEPTNDIDLLTLNVLEEALVSFPGCLLVVSHDRYFLDKIATSIIAFEGAGDVSWVQGDYTHYQRLHGERVAEEKAAASRRRAQEKQEAQQTQTPRPSNEQRLTWKEERELETIEGDIDAVEAAIRELQAVIADPNVWTEQPEHARLSSEALSVKEAEATTLVARWEELMEKSS